MRDHTEVISVSPPHQLVLRAHVVVFGSAFVTIDLREVDGGTIVEMTEAPRDGLLGRPWRLGARRLLAIGLWGRNGRSLERLTAGIRSGELEGDRSRVRHEADRDGGSTQSDTGKA